MYLNGVRNNKFEPKKPNTLIGIEREPKGLVRIAQNEHRFCLWHRDLADLSILPRKFQFTAIYFAAAIGCAHDGYHFVIFNSGGCIYSTHNGRCSEFACNNGGVAGPASFIGNDRTGAL